jgi:hypothetical protein
MATIPLVALSSKTPEQPDMLQKYGQLMQLKNMQQQSQMQQQEAPLRMQQLQQGVQSGGLQLQQQQQAQKDQQATSAAMQGWNGKDINELYPLILKNGGSSTAVMGMKDQVLKQQQAAATAFKATADGGKAQIETMKQKGDLINGALSPLMDPSQVPDAQLAQTLTSTVQDLTQKGLLDPQHAQAAAQLAQSGNPNAIRQGISQFGKTFMAQSQIFENAHKEAMTQKETVDAAAKQSELDYHAKFGGAPGISEGMQQQNDWLAKNPGKTASDYVGAKAGQESAARMPYEMALARQRQSLSQGDPNAAAKLLTDGDATLSELKARGATPDFIEKTLSAAHQMSGGKYNAQAADAQFSVAKSPANVAFFGSAKSLIDKGGTLDQLAAAGKDIPGGLIPAFNSIADWQKAASGNGPIAKYASIALGVADDYSKVMGGGQGSDSSRSQALQLIGAKQSPAQRAASISGIRGAVGSQTNSRIGNNSVMGRMYGSGDTQQQAAPSAPAGATHIVPGSDGKNHYTDGKNDLGVAP